MPVCSVFSFQYFWKKLTDMKWLFLFKIMLIYITEKEAFFKLVFLFKCYMVRNICSLPITYDKHLAFSGYELIKLLTRKTCLNF